MIPIDKIPLGDFQENFSTGEYTLGSITLTKAEYGFATKVNEFMEVVDKELTELRERVSRFEMR